MVGMVIQAALFCDSLDHVSPCADIADIFVKCTASVRLDGPDIDVSLGGILLLPLFVRTHWPDRVDSDSGQGGGVNGPVRPRPTPPPCPPPPHNSPAKQDKPKAKVT